MSRRTRHPAVFALLAVAMLTQGIPAQQTVSYDTTLFSGLTWRNVGPVRGGRSIAVAATSARPYEYYFGATGGGVWKTTDGGTTWRPVSDRHFRSSSVGALGQCESNPDVVYAGMGEVAMRGNIMQGDGMYRTEDGGKTWEHVGLERTQAIGRVRVHPTDCNTLWVAALGQPYAENEERGVFKSTDGGQNWRRVLFRNAQTGAADLIVDPSDPNTLYAGFWQVNRTPWSLESGGPGSGLFKSTDGGETWTELTKHAGLPQGLWGKVGVTVSGADRNRVWAIIEAEDGGVFRSDDAGSTWERVNDERKLRQRAFYYTRIYAHPTDAERVYVLNVAFHESKDGGKTFPRSIRVPHSDNHDLWLDPKHPDRWVNANDGGGNVTLNGGETWTEQDYPTAQLYHIIATGHAPYWVCGAQQDNSTACMQSRPSRVYADIIPIGGGESGYIASDPEQPDVFYAGNYGGYLSRFDARTGEQRTISVWPENPMGHSASEIRERFQWTFPIVFSRTGPKTLYVGSQHLWRTTNEGMSWERMSPDLTRADPKTMGPSGGPITRDQTGVETYATIFTIAPSPHDANTIWTGSDDGYVQLTRDGGRNWSNVTPKDLPEFSRISLVEVSPHQPGTAYMAAKRYQLNDRAPYLYRTDDYGRSWTKIVNGIPAHDYVHAVREDLHRPGLLWAGTEHGIYISFDRGDSWSAFSRNLPDAQVADIAVTENDLVIGTHGRSAYIMDNIWPLRQLNTQVASAAVHLFDPVDPVRGWDNALNVTYVLQDTASEVKVEFLDAAGTLIRSYTGVRDTARAAGRDADADDEEGGSRRMMVRNPTVTPGVNRFTWDLRHPGATTFPNLIMWAAGPNGPRLIPGDYQVRLTVDGHSQTQSFTLKRDPRFPEITDAELAAQLELALKVRDATTAANEGVIRIRDVKTQISERVEQDSSIVGRADALGKKFSAVEEQLYQVRNQSNQDPLNYPIRLNNKLAALLSAVEGMPGRPTQQTYEVYDVLKTRLDEQLGVLRVLIEQDLPEFNRFLQSKGLEPVVVREARPTT